MSEISGVVSQDDTKKNVVIKVTGKDENGAEVVKSYSIPFTQHSRVMPATVWRRATSSLVKVFCIRRIFWQSRVWRMSRTT